MAGIVGLTEIQHQNGTSAMTVTNAGEVAIAKRKFIHFYGEPSALITLSRGSDTTLTGFTLNEIDTDTAWDGSTFTVPSGQAGTYMIRGQVEIDFGGIGGDGEAYRMSIRKNGTITAEIQYSHNSNQGYTRFGSLIVEQIIVLAATDAITFVVNSADQSGGGGGRINTATSRSRVYGYRMDV